MINGLKILLGLKKVKRHHLYIYVTSFTVINEKQRIIEYMEFENRLEDKEKKRIRRRLKKFNPDCTIKVRGRYQTYIKGAY